VQNPVNEREMSSKILKNEILFSEFEECGVVPGPDVSLLDLSV
jgi:hypothetical protein